MRHREHDRNWNFIKIIVGIYISMVEFMQNFGVKIPSVVFFFFLYVVFCVLFSFNNSSRHLIGTSIKNLDLLIVFVFH